MRALVISDTHFGAWTGRDLLKEERYLERLAPALEGIDELIFLGDPRPTPAICAMAGPEAPS